MATIAVDLISTETRQTGIKELTALWQENTEDLPDDVRPGKPQFKIQLVPGALTAGVDSQSIARQLRAAYHEVKIDEIYHQREGFEIIARLDDQTKQELQDFDNFIVFSKTGQEIPLRSVALIMFVLPAMYTIMEDIGFVKLIDKREQLASSQAA